eukprot:g2911.t1
MTAAHCIYSEDGLIDDTNSLMIRCGITDHKDKNPKKTFYPNTTCVHHQYTGVATDGSDIALVKLNRKVVSEFPKFGMEETEDEVDDMLAVIGWGAQNEDDKMAKKLLLTPRVPFIDTKTCKRSQYFESKLLDSMICAGNGTQGTCISDLGGPLMKLDFGLKRSWKKGLPSLDEVIGIMSFGRAEKKLCRKQSIKVYTHVQSFAKWIQKTIKNSQCLNSDPKENIQQGNSSISHHTTTLSVNESIISYPTEEGEVAESSIPSESLDEDDVLERLERLEIKSEDFPDSSDIVISDPQTRPAEKIDDKRKNKVPASNSSSLEVREPEPPKEAACFSTFGSTDYEQPSFCNAHDREMTCMYYVCIDSNSYANEKTMQEALKIDAADVVQQTICCGINANASLGHPEYPLLIHAARLNAIEASKIILKNDANIDVIDSSGMTAAAHTAEKNSLGVLTILVCCGADVNKASDTQLSPLHIAASHGHVRAVEILLTAGALKTNINAHGEEPLNVICRLEDCSIETTEELRKLLS